MKSDSFGNLFFNERSILFKDSTSRSKTVVKALLSYPNERIMFAIILGAPAFVLNV